MGESSAITRQPVGEQYGDPLWRGCRHCPNARLGGPAVAGPALCVNVHHELSPPLAGLTHRNLRPDMPLQAPGTGPVSALPCRLISSSARSAPQAAGSGPASPQ